MTKRANSYFVAFNAAVIIMSLFVVTATVNAQTFMCTSNPDYFTKRCTVHPNAITKVTNGVVEKGHLVGCQFKSWSCIREEGRYQCRDNFGTTVIPFDFPMTDLKKFCYLLCNNPSCTQTQDSNSGWQ